MRIVRSRKGLFFGTAILLILCLSILIRLKLNSDSERSRNTESVDVQEFAPANLPYSVRVTRASSGMVNSATQRDDQFKGNIREKAMSFYVGQDNVFFDELKYLKQFWEEDRNFAQLRREFLLTNSLNTLDAEAKLFSQRPRPVMERIAMLDILKGYLEHDVGEDARHAAKQALESIVDMSLPRNISDQTKRILVMEKYEALQLLAQYQPEQAILSFRHLNNEPLARLLLPALNDGLVRAGLSPELVAEHIRSAQQ